VSDVELDELLREMESASIDEACERWRRAITPEAATRLIEKLRRREGVLPTTIAKILSRSIVRSGDRLPQEQGVFSTAAQGAILVSALLERIPAGEERERCAHQIIEEAVPLPFAAECLSWLRASRRHDSQRAVLSEETERALGSTLASRIANEARTAWLVEKYGKAGLRLLSVWREYGTAGEVREYLTRKFTENPTFVPRFLWAFTGNAWGMESGLPGRAHFERDAYDGVLRLVEPEVIASHLLALYDDRLDPSQYYFGSEVPSDLVVANQFLHIKNAVAQEQHGSVDDPFTDG